jgi:PST family polysaccharide transporter
MASRVPAKAWLAPQRPSAQTMKSIVAFGAPLWIAALLALAARSWDVLLVSATWGAAAVGAYNLAYNLADVPASHLGEPIGDVLTPALVGLPAEARRRALLRAVGLTTLVGAPLGVGLAVVAPTLVAVALRPEWAAVGPMLSILSLLAVVRPVGWTVGSHLTAAGRTRAVLVLGIVLVVVLFSAMSLLGAIAGPVGACFGVVAGFGVHAGLALAVAVKHERMRASSVVAALLPPLSACAAMAIAVTAVRAGLSAIGLAGGVAALTVEVVAGAVVYVAAALVVARPQALDFVALVKGALQRRREPNG